MSKISNKNILSVKKIKTISYYINESLFKPGDINVRFSIYHSLKFNISENLIFLNFLLSYNHTGESKSEEFFKMEVENTFSLTNLERYVSVIDNDVIQEEMKIPEVYLTEIVNMAISHTRAIMSHNIAGTQLENIYLPVISAKDLGKHIFGSDKFK